MNKPVYILGITAFYHDSSACLLKDGKIVAASLEERFTRIKHDNSLPINAVEFCLQQENISINNIKSIAYYEKPILKFYRLLNTYTEITPKGFIPFKMFLKSWLSKKLWVSSILKKQLGFKGDILFCKHHESHASSAYFTSPYNDAAFLTIDGVGEMATTTIGIAKENQLKTLYELNFPHSLGLLYSAFTYYCGFKVNSGEYKLMGLAPYGFPKYVDLIKKHLVKVNEDGSFELNMSYFAYQHSLKMISSNFCKLFGNEVRNPDGEMTEFYKDVAASIQKVTEDIIIGLATQAKKVTGKDYLCFSGGVALNCVANSVLQKSNIFKSIWIFPSAGDGGGSAGAALQVWHQYFNQPKTHCIDELFLHSYLGSSYSSKNIEELLKMEQLEYTQLSQKELIDQVSDILNKKAVVGWFSGKSEFGPRALGNRSIIASPAFSDMQKHLNLKIKKREGFRPFAPIVMEEHAQNWFNMPKQSKTMLFTYQCLQPAKIPSCVHIDGSSRVQTMNRNDNEKFYSLLEEFYQKSGIPLLINTSFNVRGEPIVNSPIDAIQCFFNTDMDALVLENYLLLKEKQAPHFTKKYQLQYEPD